jgi:inosine/xanthosine triphosphatase
MIVAGGSPNPTKINPVKKIFSKYFKEVEVIGVDVPSGVSDQPLSEEEIYKGALNRAKRALKKVEGAEFGVGIEGGIMEHFHGHYEKAAIVIIDKKGRIGIGMSPGLFLPEKVISHIKNGKNLTQAIDALFGTKNIGKGIGAYGVFTKGVVTRAKGMEHGIAFALSRFLHKDLF